MKKTELDRKRLLDQLDNDVSNYFDYVDRTNLSVIRFNELVQDRKFTELIENWDSISQGLIQAERKMGHKGRAILLDHFCNIEKRLKKLMK